MTTEHRLLTTKGLAEHLRMTPRWVYDQVEMNGMPAYRLGRRALRFDLEAVEAWLAVRKVGDWPDTGKPCAKPISHVSL